jgi:phosphatidylglycerophosphate synthase
MITWANSITASRLIFFALCIRELSYNRPTWAIYFFLFAWGLDAIDGVIARAMKQDTVFGSQLDKVIDRIVLAGTVIALMRYRYLPPMALFLLVKDVGLAMALTANARGSAFPSASWKGKLTSFLQGAGILWLFAGLPFQEVVVGTTGLFGAYVAVDYLRKL